MTETLAACEVLIAQRQKQHVVLNAAKVVAAVDNQELRQIINHCDLVNADGMAVVWAARLLGIKISERVAGIDLMNQLVDLSVEKRYSLALLGARQEVIELTAQEFSNRGANVVGYRNGYWTSEQELDIVNFVSGLRPDILFLAIPSPQKEEFLSKNLAALNAGLVVGVGGSFDVVAGVTKRAPLILQNIGLEWAYRLVQEPRRMFKRYLVGNTKFIRFVLTYWAKQQFSKWRARNE
jgi:N-acetylglucosaminyldiphosphoundecaprenol N-acetyl-beta-D-mannosaminyltransferase